MKEKVLAVAKPQPDEYPPYASQYIDLVSDHGDLLSRLRKQRKKTIQFFNQLSPRQLLLRYAPGKWSIKETLIHIIDDERIYAYRALRIARGDTTPLPGFEQDEYIPFTCADQRSLASLLKEYKSVRKATLTLFESFSPADTLRRGHANGHAVSVRALMYHLAGHELHHLRLVKEKYL